MQNSSLCLSTWLFKLPLPKDAAADVPAGDNAVERALVLTRATLCRVSVATVAMQHACEGRRVCVRAIALLRQKCLCKVPKCSGRTMGTTPFKSI